MANIQYGSTSGKVPVKQNLLKDMGNAWLNTALSPIEGITGKNFFNPEMTTGFGKTLKGIGDAAGNIASATVPFIPGVGTAISAVGKGVGSIIDAPPTSGIGAGIGGALGSLAGNKDAMEFAKGLFRKGGYLKYKRAMKKYADGGIILPTYINMPENNEHAMGGDLTRYNGMKHEDGGIPISNTDEVEGGETSFKQGSNQPNDPGTFIFSDSILVPGTKKTFADESKKIDNRYKKRENDLWATNAKKMQLGKLAELQEQVKGTTEQQGMQMSPDGSVHKMGGKIPSMMKANGTSRYNLSKKMMNMHDGGGGITNFGAIGSGTYDPNKKVPYAPYIQPLPNTPVVNSVVNRVATQPMVNNSSSYYMKDGKNTVLNPNFKSPDIPLDNAPVNSFNPGLMEDNNGPNLDYLMKQTGLTPNLKEISTTPKNNPKSDMTIPLAGYGLQAATNLPMLFSKPNKATYDRITPDKVDLTGQRLEAQGSRNRALALSRRNASMLGSASAVNAYTGATVSDIYGKYGDQINNSLMNEKVTNAQIGNTAKGQNAQIQMSEVEANQREADAVRGAKQQALFNIGQSVAAAGKAVGNSKQTDNMMQNLASGDYSYDKSTGNYILKRKGYNKYGGKLKKGGCK